MSKESKISFTTIDQDACVNFPPIPATKIVPEWYKNLPVSLPKEGNYIAVDGIPSIKRCVPVLDYLTSGYILRNSYEINAWPGDNTDGIKDFKLECNNPDYVAAHPWHQAKVELNGVKNHYFKINQDWLIKTPPGYSCLIYQPHYLFRKEFQFFPAIVDTDKHDDFIGLVGLINTDQPFTIAPGDPLVTIFPFKREEWKMDVQCDPNAEAKSSFKYFLPNAWHGFYSKFFHSKKTYR
jgi:hypothetical protein